MLNLIIGNNTENNYEFIELFRKSYSQIQNKSLHNAIESYNQIYEKFSSLKEKEKTQKLKNDLKLLFEELNLYLKLNSAYSEAISNNLKPLMENLEKLHDLAYEVHKTEITPSLIEKINKKHKFHLEIYTKRPSIQDFEKTILSVEDYLGKQYIGDSLLAYCQLNIILVKIMSFIPQKEKIELFFKTRKIFKNLVLRALTLKPKKAKKNSNINMLGFEDTYQKIQDALKKGDIKTATKLYKYL